MSSDQPSSDEWKERNQRQFDQLAESYDRLGFLTQTAQFLAEQVEVSPGQAVLDVMTGTGTVALALVSKVLPQGRMVGLDLSEGMLAVARAKAAELGQEDGGPLSFVQGDAAHLPFSDESFDVVVCASGLFFVPDMLAALREWRRVVRPGGQILFSSYGPGLMGDLPMLWRNCLGRYGVKPGFPPLGRIPSLEAAQELLQQSGLGEVQTQLIPVPYLLPSPAARWVDIESGLEGAPLKTFTPEMRLQIRDEHLTELGELFGGESLTVPLPVVVASGRVVSGRVTSGLHHG